MINKILKKGFLLIWLMFLFSECRFFPYQIKMNYLYAIVDIGDADSDTKKNEIKKSMVMIKQPEKIHVAKGKSTTMHLEVKVAAGYHVQANPAGKFLIPIKLIINSNKNWSVGSPNYPQAKLFRMKGSKEDIPVFDGDFVISVPLKTTSITPFGDHNLEGTLTYQACNEVTCFFKESLKFKFLVNVSKEEKKEKTKKKTKKTK